MRAKGIGNEKCLGGARFRRVIAGYYRRITIAPRRDESGPQIIFLSWKMARWAIFIALAVQRAKKGDESIHVVRREPEWTNAGG